MANKDAVKKLKAFLESTPPGVPVCIPELAEEKSRNPMVLIPNPGTYWRVLAVAPAILELHCDVDDGVRRFYASKKNAPVLASGSWSTSVGTAVHSRRPMRS